MTRVGVIGGGQLAWMMAKEAPTQKIILSVQTPSSDDSAVSLADNVILAPIDSMEGTKKLAQKCDVITFENEFVDLEALQTLAEKGVCFRPSLNSLAPLLDKYEQRCFLKSLGLPVPRFKNFERVEDLESFGFPLVLKVRRHGYDGQGTMIVKSAQELESALKTLGNVPFLVEEFIPFECELAVIVARGLDGMVCNYPVVETFQQNQVCRWTIAPANVTIAQTEEVKRIAHKLLTALDYVGVMGIELFLGKNGQILVNETAPRTHNSGHYTLNGCITSQFALQLQAVTGKPLGNLSFQKQGAIMVNLLGLNHPHPPYEEKLQKISTIEDAFIHWYEKTESRPGRKMGHITVLTNYDTITHARAIVEQIEAIWYDLA
ncbi:5-(carboxyamino)imidazole ribonucleotide synthase [Cyanobacterium stanieri LEGE 03274]|uniref:N5-carboxyaminoimidazole ribonucleotide synthase n=1 Tax=Cyanobacterium stanieri LEGE 03274 TaxID=1828756 RepID=A0ABR9V000_9CHRO|nr:5-(carboxyamino)imidazole ribonucleotide synthase [Cyanobacterium stanieri]MBE9221182.1 5-(carboxyamino)imidazole ribonucleotide synthase [Cyanobacterium stanieri LEGE 03274]